MGTLLYGQAGQNITIEDRTLAHLQIVIGAKLRRQEGFFLSWRTGEADDLRRTSLWMHPSIPVQFVFDGDGNEQINRLWLDKLSLSANSALGLQLTDEPVVEQQHHSEPVGAGAR